MENQRTYDLEERLLQYGSDIITCVETLRPTRAAKHVGDQLLRAGTSPLFNHGEAESAESPKDFIHKLKICLKELREAFRALRLVEKADLSVDLALVKRLQAESDELIRIFYCSIVTTRKRLVKETDSHSSYEVHNTFDPHSMLDVGCSMFGVQKP